MTPPGRYVVVIVGGMSTGLIMMMNPLVSSPTLFNALTAKEKVPSTVGVPEITPVFGFKFNPFGKLVPGMSDQVIGVVPVA